MSDIEKKKDWENVQDWENTTIKMIISDLLKACYHGAYYIY